MEFNTYVTDLYILPQTQREQHNLQNYLQTKKINYEWSYSDVKGQSWYGKIFVEIPFGIDLKNDIIEYSNITK